MKKKLPLQLDNVFSSYSYHSYISSILLESRAENSPNVDFSNLKVIPHDSNAKWYQSSVSNDLNQQEEHEPIIIQDLNQAYCHAGDISGLDDSFNYIHTKILEYKGLEVKIDYIKNTSVWSKAGLMLRESLDPSSKYLFLFATPSVNGVVIQIRNSKGDNTNLEYVLKINPPLGLKMEIHDDQVSLYFGNDIDGWRLLRSLPFRVTSEYYMGLALCSPENNAYLNWYSSNYIQLYCYKNFSENQIPFDFNVGLHKDRNYFAFCPYLKTQTLHYPLIELIEKNNLDIIELMINFLEDGNYVDVELDEIFVPNRRAFEKYNRPHTNLLYGYNRIHETFDMVGYAKGNIFYSSKLTFTDFKHAFIRNKNSNVMLLRIHHYYNYKLNSFMIKKQLEAQLNSIDFYSSLSTNRNYEPNIMYGLNVYDCLIENFPSHQRDIRPLHVVYEHKKLMLTRLIHIHRNGVINDDIFEILYSGYKELEKISLICRNAQLKNKISKKYNNVDNILKNIQTIKLLESELLPIFINNIK